MCRFSPSELLFNSEILKHKSITEYIKNHMACSVELLDDADYEPKSSFERMRGQFGDFEILLGIRREGVIFYSIASLLAYLGRPRKRGLSGSRPSIYIPAASTCISRRLQEQIWN